ncbi:MAG: SPFH/Band 7/PHB domain protein [Neisseriaceae bacterium]|nr:SPFH/Band 7/PHB domain protein [Neisseriaceae bacterium]
MSFLPIFFLVLAVVFVFNGFKVVPQQHAFIVERLGKFHSILHPGLNFIIPFVDRISYSHTLKEVPLDIPSQICITRDNTQLKVDGIIYFQVTDPKLASYGSSNYILAITQLAQTTLRSVIGRMELDKTFEERDEINRTVVMALDEAGVTCGVKVLRYEIKDLEPPKDILLSMQAQITAEREKRALVAASEGRKVEQINIAMGQREAAIKASEGEKQALINESEGQKLAAINQAEGQSQALLLMANATAEALIKIGAAVQMPGGMEAVNLKVAERYVDAFSELAKTTNTMLLPSNPADISSMVATAMSVMQTANK